MLWAAVLVIGHAGKRSPGPRAGLLMESEVSVVLTGGVFRASLVLGVRVGWRMESTY